MVMYPARIIEAGGGWRVELVDFPGIAVEDPDRAQAVAWAALRLNDLLARRRTAGGRPPEPSPCGPGEEGIPVSLSRSEPAGGAVWPYRVRRGACFWEHRVAFPGLGEVAALGGDPEAARLALLGLLSRRLAAGQAIPAPPAPQPGDTLVDLSGAFLLEGSVADSRGDIDLVDVAALEPRDRVRWLDAVGDETAACVMCMEAGVMRAVAEAVPRRRARLIEEAAQGLRAQPNGLVDRLQDAERRGIQALWDLLQRGEVALPERSAHQRMAALGGRVRRRALWVGR